MRIVPCGVTIAGLNDFIPSSYTVVKGQSLGSDALVADNWRN